jgi:hypothetical protein
MRNMLTILALLATSTFANALRDTAAQRPNSIADELRKLAELRSEGVISDTELKRLRPSFLDDCNVNRRCHQTVNRAPLSPNAKNHESNRSSSFTTGLWRLHLRLVAFDFIADVPLV